MERLILLERLQIGKTFYVNLDIGFLGDEGAWAYATELPANYLSQPTRKDTEASRPTTNKLMGTRLAYIKEAVADDMIPDVCKSLLDPNDGRMSARGNNSRATDRTAFA